MERAAPLWLAALLGGLAGAATFDLSAAERQNALSAGQALAAKHQGYPVADYLIYDVHDALQLHPDQGSVEAVQVATPWERARWAGYLLSVQGKPVSEQAAQVIDDLKSGQVDFIVFAHSSGEGKDYQNFLKTFSAAHLNLGSRDLTPVNTAYSGAAVDNYRDLNGNVTFLWSGNVTYRFDLSQMPSTPQSGTLSFTDASGKKWNLKVDLSQYK
ncbi:hypothetical protein DKM44_08725 [Deinococcus irradiatisoli]|uniref:Uncharacterized protein n=1 Tax=Deinococcus irradiatisoli TaxID=2202254 RepID=A0A2Z3JDP6_9DEIO|nr:hypothetical protein [Deinococcus irradiatisoli]AWN23303.1 hypothetical protein DKM44_08725 [Deinococcus irradiatisoli]